MVIVSTKQRNTDCPDEYPDGQKYLGPTGAVQFMIIPVALQSCRFENASDTLFFLRYAILMADDDTSKQ